MKAVRLIKDRQERFNIKRGWFVNAFRLVDSEGTDQAQPWFNTRKDAREFAASQGWTVTDESK